MRGAAFARILVGCTFAGRAVFADPTADAALASTRLDEARALMDQGRFAEACPKLEESERLNPTGKAILNLADCYEKNGQTASAHARFEQAADRALAAQRSDIEKLARSRARELERRLSTLTIAVPRDREGLAVRRDGAVVPKTSWGAAIPIDPGLHRVEATATGEAPFTAQVTVGPQHDLVVVTIPDPKSASATAAVTRPGGAPAREPSGDGGRTAGFLIAGLGVVGIGVGAFFGVRTFARKSEAKDACPDADHVCTDPVRLAAAQSAHDAASTSALVSTIAFGVGAAALGVGSYLLLTAGPVQVAPTAGLNAAGLDVTGRF